MVMQNKSPNKRCVNTIEKPPKINQMIFIIVDRHPILEEVSVILTPNGAKATMANLKH